MERLFVQTGGFQTQLDAFNNSSELLIDIEQEVLKDLVKKVSQREIISGTGGFTKLRVAFEGRGKSGSARVIYLDCPQTERVFLFMIYSKAKIVNISDGTKKILKAKSKELKA